MSVVMIFLSFASAFSTWKLRKELPIEASTSITTKKLKKLLMIKNSMDIILVLSNFYFIYLYLTEKQVFPVYLIILFETTISSYIDEYIKKQVG